MKPSLPTPAQLIMPLFLVRGRELSIPLKNLPGQCKMSCDRAVAHAGHAWRAGIRSFLLYNVDAEKSDGRDFTGDPLLKTAAAEIKGALPAAALIADLCLCAYTSHGHCGVLGADGAVDNDRTNLLLAEAGVDLARSGIDCLMPSAMTDGMVASLRSALDRNGLADSAIIGQSAKLASSYYGPFRRAAHAPLVMGPPDKKTYQVNPANGAEIIREIREDISEGADIVMLKPALPCLDLIFEVKREIDTPLAAFFTSGEYGLIKAAAEAGVGDESRLVAEAFSALHRAGADIIVSYFALDYAKWWQAGV